MRVSHAEDHVTHAVIGGEAAIDFGITDSPEFMQMLSSVLYTDQILAVVRESLCNTWDAHIEAGITDKAVDVKLTETELVIRDYGLGIPKAMIGPIYGTYGGSTKKNDGKQTGGFGLGCKSPFAYGDHFDVTSFNNGEKTLYKMSKSSAVVGGKPSITPILTVPTDETGLELRMKIKSEDHRRFQELIRRIASNGDMNLNLNDTPVIRIPFSRMEHDFLITKYQLIDNTNFQIFCRYGNVIYPVEDNEAYTTQYSTIKNFLNRLGGANQGYRYAQTIYRIVFQAPPHSISVTPSRESLSMQDHTINTLKGLFDDFLELKDKNLQNKIIEVTEESINNTYLVSAPSELLKTDNVIPNLKKQELKDDYLFKFEEMAVPYATSVYPEFHDFRKKEILFRLNSLINSGFGNKGLIQSYRAAFEREFKNGLFSDWFHRQVLAPLLYRLEDHKELKANKLFIYDQNKNRSWDTTDRFTDPKKYSKRLIQDYLPFLRNFIILSYNRADVSERAPRFPIMRYWLGSIVDSLVYIVPRTPSKVEAARKFFQERGMTVIDLTKAQPWEHSTAAEPEVKIASPTAKLKGIPFLKNMLHNGAYSSTNFTDPDLPRTQNPEFVLKFSSKNQTDYIPLFGPQGTKILIDLYGDKCGIVVNENQEKKYVANGAQEAVNYILNDLKREFTSNQRIKESLPFNWSLHREINGRYYGDPDFTLIFKAVFKDPDLIEYFDMTWSLTPEDKKYINLWKIIQASYQFGYNSKIYKEIQDLMVVKLDPKIDILLKRMQSSLALRALDWSHILEVMSKDKININNTQVDITSAYRDIIKNSLVEAIEYKG